MSKITNSFEFYDVRAVEAALCALNSCDIGGKQIKIEPSPPGGNKCNVGYAFINMIDPQQIIPFLKSECSSSSCISCVIFLFSFPPYYFLHLLTILKYNLLQVLEAL
ncbi:hypothetical protein SLEP1_g52621 [Rubroshorea leprosula]|uniref:Mei2-like C-terminal RNA recognition motif domain-containing protein n=1 Tax=Rubroshorea leprosula TaxID=152421 RepID=A0AAV5MAM2_9ROSI|nr:hypothetical protein SLEP1_g52621 [Rubroshorea leprosula]